MSMSCIRGLLRADADCTLGRRRRDSDISVGRYPSCRVFLGAPATPYAGLIVSRTPRIVPAHEYLLRAQTGQARIRSITIPLNPDKSEKGLEPVVTTDVMFGTGWA